MRIKIVNGIDKDGINYPKIIDAITGEEVQGVKSVTVRLAPDYCEAVLEVVDFDADIEVEVTQ